MKFILAQEQKKAKFSLNKVKLGRDKLFMASIVLRLILLNFLDL